MRCLLISPGWAWSICDPASTGHVHSSSAFLTATAISLFVRGLITKAFIPAALALSASIRWLKPVHMIMGILALSSEDLLNQFLACHLRHGLISNDQVEPGRIQSEERKGLPRARLPCDTVTHVREHIIGHLHKVLLIVNEEYPFVSPGNCVSFVTRIFALLLRNDGQKDRKGRAFTRFTGHGNRAAMARPRYRELQKVRDRSPRLQPSS